MRRRTVRAPVALGQFGEVPLGVASPERVEREADAIEEGPEVAQVGRVGPEGVRAARARVARALEEEEGRLVVGGVGSGDGAHGAWGRGSQTQGEETKGSPIRQPLLGRDPSPVASRRLLAFTRRSPFQPFTPIRVAPYKGDSAAVARQKIGTPG